MQNLIKEYLMVIQLLVRHVESLTNIHQLLKDSLIFDKSNSFLTKEAKHDDDWTIVMKKELNQFERNIAWSSVPKSKDHPIIGTEWIF